MFCTKCGAQVAEGAKFCGQCGAAVPVAETSAGGTGKLVRPRSGYKIAGVCAAFANAYGWDVTVVRIVTLMLALCACGGALGYVVAWVCIPKEE